MTLEILTKPVQLQEFAYIPNSQEDILMAIQAGDGSQTLQPYNNLTIEGLCRLNTTLLEAPEAIMGSRALSKTLENSGFPAYLLQSRAFYPPQMWDVFLQSYADDVKTKYRVPAEDVLVIQKPDGETVYVSRSSLWPGIFDGVALAMDKLSTPGDVIAQGSIEPCFRREVQEEDGWRKFGFTQAHIELSALRDETVNAQTLDTVATRLLIQSLQEMDIPDDVIQIRVNNFMDIVYNILGDRLSFVQKEELGRALNQMAFIRQAQGVESTDYLSAQRQAQMILGKFNTDQMLTTNAYTFIQNLVQTGEYDLDELEQFGEAFRAYQDLEDLVRILNSEYPEIAISIDPLSIRGGTPAYDRTTMQADITCGDQKFIEVAGGGAYERAAKTSWKILSNGDEAPEEFYQVGFALGLLRIQTAKRCSDSILN